VFTGLVKDIGEIKSIRKNQDGLLISVSSTLISEIDIDDSVSIDGVCQTVVKIDKINNIFSVQAIGTTLQKTRFKEYRIGTKVNLELALRLSDRLGGHLVSGHVNNVGSVSKIQKLDKSAMITIAYPIELSKYIIKEGSITINGVSLTISSVKNSSFSVSVIPHTLQETNLGHLKNGDNVNLEVDMIAKYLENIISKNKVHDKNKDNILVQKLKNMGF